MAVFYKFKCAKDYSSIPLDGPYISVGNLKEIIFKSAMYGKGIDFDLLVANAQTNEDYLDESMLIPKGSSVLIRRVPGMPRKPIVTAPLPEPDDQLVRNECKDVQSGKSGFVAKNSSTMKFPDDLEWDEFFTNLHDVPGNSQSSYLTNDDSTSSKNEEDQKIKALVETPALDWQCQSFDGASLRRGFARGVGSKVMKGHGLGQGVLGQKTPPQGYVCHRCNVPGHFIQHCPTNGDPNYDIIRVKPPTGIPKCMLVAASDGSYTLPNGALAVLKPNEAAFEKEIEGLPSSRPVCDIPPELRCPLCREVMKDAVFTSKCCFKSFCDKCIRDFTISKLICKCGATYILADDLLPNLTLRDTINRILESGNCSGSTGGSSSQVLDVVESHNRPAKSLSPAQNVVIEDEQPSDADPVKIEPSRGHEIAHGGTDDSASTQTSERVQPGEVGNESEAIHKSISDEKPALQASAPLAVEEVHQKPVCGEAAKKKKMKKARFPLNEMQWSAPPDFAAEKYMMSLAHVPFNPYWTNFQPGMEGYIGPYAGAVPYMGFEPGAFEFPFAGVFSSNPFSEPARSLPFCHPQSNPVEFRMGFSAGSSSSKRGQVVPRKSDVKRKHEMERPGGSQEVQKEVISSGGLSSGKSKSKTVPSPGKSEHSHHHQRRSERSSPDSRSRDTEPSRQPSSRSKTEHHHRHHDDQKHASAASGRKHRDYESSEDSDDGDNERHFKRRRRSRHDHDSDSSSERYSRHHRPQQFVY